MLVVFCGLPVDAENWPNWRGPLHDGTSRETDLPVTWSEQSGVVWRCDLPSWGNSTPVIWGDAVFLTSHVDDRDLVLLKIEKPTGKIQWVRQVGIGATPLGMAGVTGNAARGQQKFHRTQNLASPSCTTDGEVVVAHFGNGDLAAYDFEGNRLWYRNLQKDYGKYTIWWGHANSPLLYDGLVISICMQDSLTDLGREASPSYVAAHDKRTGELVWFTPRPTSATSESCDSYTTPSLRRVGNKAEIVVFGGQVLDAYDPHDGRRLWELAGLGGNRVIPGAVVAGEKAFVTQGMRSPLLAVALGAKGELDRSAILWSYDRGTSDSPTPVVWKGLLFFITNDGFATCLDTESGAMEWKERLPGQYRASPLAAGDRIYFLNVDGLTTVVAASREFDKIAENRLGEETFASLVVSDGRVFLRGRSRLYCIGN
ncbi:MAG: PQQ-like beta-propeller repeat protein [Planctomycetes bacterium]|nr:PQQ-like beta-propeller repeat protein [Planctomycetota bacterium]